MKSITIDPEIMSGEPVFSGTRVPIKSLFDNLEDGMGITEFMENYPSVTIDKIIDVLETASNKLRVA
jgi:uncharacterized protein (DUF433 family)